MSPVRIPPAARRAGLVATAVLAAIGVAAFVRGSLVDTVERDPATSDEPVRCQILDRGGGQRPVRCVKRIDAPPAAVAAIVRDYGRFPEMFSARFVGLSLTEVTPEPGDVVHLVGRIRTPVYTWPLDVRVRHETRDGDVHVASWAEPRGAMMGNRGAWTIKPAGGGGSLLSYELEVDAPRAPRFLVNDVLLAEIPFPVGRVAEAARKRP
jgi:hypothetical protein